MQPDQIEKMVESVAGILTALASIALAAMMFLMAADVVCRYFLNSPIPGALELVEFLMAVTVPLSIAYCASQRSHVSVEMVVERFSSPVRTAIEIVVTVLSLLFILVVSWQSILNIFESYDSKITSAVLHIPAFPFVVPVAIGMSCYAAIMLIQLIVRKSKEIGHEPH